MTHQLSDRFLSAFSRIEHCIRKMAGGSIRDRFSDLLSSAVQKNVSVRPFENDLREFAELRNAIVHERGGGYPIAEPHQATVEKLEKIALLISQPPTVESIDSRQVITCCPEDPIGKSARAMFERKFSQLPVYQDKIFIGL